MTNEELLRRYHGGDEESLEQLCRRSLGLIRRVAEEAAGEFNCLRRDTDRPEELSTYTKTILDDLCAEGMLELLTRVRDGKYDESKGKFTTYLYPHLKGRMLRWLERNIGNISLSKDEMADVRRAQKLYHADGLDIDEVAEKLSIPREQARRHIQYNTHFLGVYDLVPEDEDGDPFEWLIPDKLTASAERIVYRKVCVELLRELFDALPRKDRDILGKCYGVFGFKETELKEIGMYHMMKESAVEKAKNRALKKLENAYPGSRLQLWRAVHQLMRRPIPPPDAETN